LVLPVLLVLQAPPVQLEQLAPLAPLVPRQLLLGQQDQLGQLVLLEIPDPLDQRGLLDRQVPLEKQVQQVQLVILAQPVLLVPRDPLAQLGQQDRKVLKAIPVTRDQQVLPDLLVQPVRKVTLDLLVPLEILDPLARLVRLDLLVRQGHQVRPAQQVVQVRPAQLDLPDPLALKV
jgi:hypothetical protein